MEAHEEAFTKTAGKGTKIDLVLTQIRIGFFHSDPSLVSAQIDRAQKLVDEGGDWDRRNRLKVYSGLQLLSVRSFKKASELLLDALPTFTATELIEYDEFVTLCVLAGVFALERKDLKAKVRFSPP
jgi:26S proteasome regulatory subunit N7